jgi:bifunctional DNase/RNase
MIRVELSRIIIDEKRQDQVIVLKEKDGDRQIPIVIGFMEASSIKIKISGVDLPRPMTHDLLVQVLGALGGQLEKVIIDKLISNTFHAKLEVKTKEGEIKIIDARPSDSIALAVRLKAPMYVSDEVAQQSTALNS